MAYPLTQNLILQKTKMSELRYVKKLNCCNAQMDDITILQDTPNLEVCSLSANNIESLFGLGGGCALRELYLRNNRISDIRQVLFLSGHDQLETLNLLGNPICAATNYRSYVIAAVPSLTKLDDEAISAGEREEAELLFPGLHLERPPSPPPHGSPMRPVSAAAGVATNSQSSMSASFARRSPPPPQERMPATPTFQQQQQQHTSPVLQRRSSFNNSVSNGSFGAKEAPPLARDPYSSGSFGGAAPPIAPRAGSGLAEAKRREVTERKREEAAVVAVKTLLNEMSAESLAEIQRHIATLQRGAA